MVAVPPNFQPPAPQAPAVAVARSSQPSAPAVSDGKIGISPISSITGSASIVINGVPMYPVTDAQVDQAIVMAQKYGDPSGARRLLSEASALMTEDQISRLTGI